jgi:Tfp pilus assembly protein PilF
MDETEKTMTPEERANERLEEGKAFLASANYKDAKQKFQESVDSLPCAESLTLLAWMISMEGEITQALNLCLQAIKLDPDYGHAHNDIGSYLVELEKPTEAIPYFEKAKLAANYDTPSFPYVNLARLYLREEDFEKACLEYKELLEIDHNHTEAHFVLGYFGKDDKMDYPFSGLFPIN